MDVVQSGSWTPLDVPVTLKILTAPSMSARVDDAARSIALAGSGYPKARIVVLLEDQEVGTAKADADGNWYYTVQDLGFGPHRIGAVQHFDGSRNGGVEDVYTIDGSATDLAAEVDTDRGTVELSGRGPVGTEIALERDGQPVLVDGAPVRVPVGDDGRWTASVPVLAEQRLVRLDAVTLSAGAEVGRASVDVTVPQALTAAVVEDQGRRVVLGGTGEPGATVRFTHENGAPLLDRDGAPITAVVGRGEWKRTIDTTGVRGARVLVTQEQGGRIVGRASVTIP